MGRAADNAALLVYPINTRKIWIRTATGFVQVSSKKQVSTTYMVFLSVDFFSYILGVPKWCINRYWFDGFKFGLFGKIPDYAVIMGKFLDGFRCINRVSRKKKFEESLTNSFFR